jgi:trehalose 6-phosphate synthase
MIAVVVFPVGIDPGNDAEDSFTTHLIIDKFVESLKQPETQRFIDSYSKQFEGKKVQQHVSVQYIDAL